MPKKNFLLPLFFVYFLLLLVPVRSYCMEARVTDFLVTNTTEDVLVYFRVTNCFTESMEKAVFAGIPATFTFLLELYQEREYWFDKKESRLEIKHTIKYDNVKKIFYVSLAENGGKPMAFSNFDEAKGAMADLNGVAIASLKLLKRDKQYYIRAKAQLDKVRLPLHMEYIFFFVSMWDFETDWYKQGFVY